MLINLINTILISCGMALNGTNFNYEHKERKNAADVVEIDKSYTGYMVGEQISYMDSITSQYSQVNKYLLESKSTIQENYFTIYNSSYNFGQMQTNEVHYTNYTIIKITNYYNVAINLELEVIFRLTENQGNIYKDFRRKYWITEYNMDEIINLTTNQYTQSYVETIFSRIPSEDLKYNVLESNSSANEVYNTTTEDIGFQVNKTLYIAFRTDISRYATPHVLLEDFTRNNTLNITGSAVVPQQNIEVVDVPSMMFTILTLPFSFISQAFNLTIFPNTPYSINFSNLFLTIISIFVLIWLIKHIIK